MKKMGVFQFVCCLLWVIFVFSCQSHESQWSEDRPKRIYYVDSVSGDDGNDGSSPSQAVKTIEKINGMRFLPGDTILLKADTEYTGCLQPKGSGVEGHPIIIGRYGEGPPPAIHAEGKYKQALLLSNQHFWEVNNLEITNHGEKRALYRYGVRISASNFGVMRHIHLRNLYIHDVNGTLQKQDRAEGHGILYENTGIIPSYFDDLLIEGCRLEHVDRNGIGGHTRYRTRQNIKNLHVRVRKNILEDIGGDGIKVKGCDGAVAEYNVVKRGSQRHEGFSCGIWPFSSVNTIIQYNEVCYMKGTRDGQAFDSDFDGRNNVFQYNYSHDNDGGFILLCSPPISQRNIGNHHTVIRYNISQNDKARIFLFGGPVQNARIYNNVIYTRSDLDVKLFHFAPRRDPRTSEILWGQNIQVQNNIFYSDGMARLTYNRLPMKEDGTYIGIDGPGLGDIHFRNNLFYGRFNSIFWNTRTNIRDDPMLQAPGTGKEGFDTLSGYTLQQQSPCIDAGLKILTRGFTDFWGNALAADAVPDIGAHEY